MLSLLKTQSSHYVFPGAAFLSFFIAQTFCSWWNLRAPGRSLPLWVPVAAAALIFASAYLYSPSRLKSFLKKPQFSGEDRLAARLQRLALPTDPYLLSQRPELLTGALDDPALKLVEFDPQDLQFDDPLFLATEHHKNLVRLFSERLQERFIRVPNAPSSLRLWIRKTS